MSTGNLPEDKAVESSMDKLVAKQFSSHTFLDGVISLAGVASPNRRSSMRAISVCPAFLLILLLGGVGWAQTMVPQATAAPSPVVQSDGTVSFHLLAPTASSVSLDADYPISPGGYGNTRKQLPLTKDDKGDWSLTVGPLKPEFYSYSFLVDGARMPDPQNVRMTRDGLRYMNWAVVTGPGSANYEFNDLPHGQRGGALGVIGEVNADELLCDYVSCRRPIRVKGSVDARSWRRWWRLVAGRGALREDLRCDGEYGR
jgi:hypothetical protein